MADYKLQSYITHNPQFPSQGKHILYKVYILLEQTYNIKKNTIIFMLQLYSQVMAKKRYPTKWKILW